MSSPPSAFTPTPAPNAMAEARTQPGGRATGVTAKRQIDILATPSPPSGFLCFLNHQDYSTSSAVKLLLPLSSRFVSYLILVLNLHLKKEKNFENR
ncbi:hypothetical protein N665_0651s0002 [Sinapis alba]|nr:hypothetical protein N665_0651s0002 [Sinapis alba]